MRPHTLKPDRDTEKVDPQLEQYGKFILFTQYLRSKNCFDIRKIREIEKFRSYKDLLAEFTIRRIIVPAIYDRKNKFFNRCRKDRQASFSARIDDRQKIRSEILQLLGANAVDVGKRLEVARPFGRHFDQRCVGEDHISGHVADAGEF